VRPTPLRLITVLIPAAMVLIVTPLAPAAGAVYCDGHPATITQPGADGIFRGTTGPDVIVGTSGPDIIYGRDGDDVICGGDGSDQIYGGPGNDLILGGAGNDTLYGGRGIDRLRTQAGTDVAVGGPDWDYCDRATTRRGCEMVIPAETFEQGFTAEDWRGLVTAVFGDPQWQLGDEIDNAIRIIDCESNGDPWAFNAGGPVAGLFQHRTTYWDGRSEAAGVGGHSPYDPRANATVAAYLVHQDKYDVPHAAHGPWTDWNGCGPHPGVLDPPWDSW
jgi:hypothetical protein